MKSKLVFEGKGEELVYQWGKYTVGRGYHYNWQKYEINSRNLYHWKKYKTKNIVDITYNWDGYKLITTPGFYSWEKVKVPQDAHFVWDKYSCITAGTTFYTWNKFQGLYSWGKYNIKKIPQYREEYQLDGNEKIYSTKMDGIPKPGSYLIDYSKYNKNDFYKIGVFKYEVPRPNYPHEQTDISFEEALGERVFYKTMKLNPLTGQFDYSDYDGISYGTWGQNYIKADGSISEEQSGEIGTFNFTRPGLQVGDKFFCRCGSNPSYYSRERGWGDLADENKRLPLIRTGVPSEDPYRIRPIMFCVEIGEGHTYSIYVSNAIIQEVVLNSKVHIGDIDSKGDYISDVTSSSKDDFPQDGTQGGYWYEFQSEIAGEFIEQVKSQNIDKYIQNKINSDGYFYGSRGHITAPGDVKDQYIGEVSSRDKSDYPVNGPKKMYNTTYWYELKSENENPRYYQGRKISTTTFVKSNDYITVGKSYSFNQTDGTYQVILDTTQILKKDFSHIPWGILYQQGMRYFSVDAPPHKKIYQLLYDTGSHGYNEETGEFDFLNLIECDVQYSTGLAYEPGEYLGFKAQNNSLYQLPSKEQVYTKGSYIGRISSKNENEYPSSGHYNGTWYESVAPSSTTTTVKGDYIGQQDSLSLDNYPRDGIMNGYWYEYQNYTIDYIAGVFIGTISSNRIDAYPNNGTQDGYWYKYLSTDTDNYPYKFVDIVTNPDSSAYPQNGEKNDYWYIYLGTARKDLYTLTDSELLENVSYQQVINPENDFSIGCASSAEISFKIKATEADAQKYVGLTARYYTQQGEDNEWRLIGKFNITNIKSTGKQSVELKGYDNMVLFDIYIDSWLDSIKFPITIKELYQSLCLYCKVPFAFGEFINQEYKVNDNFKSVNITGRQVLSYIGEIASSYIVANPNGSIEIKKYLNAGVKLDNTRYKTISNSLYEIEPIDKLTVLTADNDVGVSAGSGKNVYKITNNPLFYSNESSKIQPIIDNIFNELKQVLYTPCSIEMYEDFNINCGDIIEVDGLIAYVMKKEITPSGVKIYSFGNRYRANNGENSSSEIIALRGKTNTLTRSIEETNSKLVDTEKKLSSEITQSADEINAKITYQGGTISQIQQSLNGIKMEYNSVNGTASITIGDLTVTNLVNNEYVDNVVAGINLKGYVRFTDLAESGSTSINGNNITTGTISADRINLTGAISWGDLSSSTKNQIISTAEDAGARAGGVPGYIHNSYIDSTKIYSPTIYGAEIYAGTSTDGYIKLASTGLNFCSKNGGSVMGMGYYASKYNLPYMIFGAGVDSYGTDRGMIKKYARGIWIGDSDGLTGDVPKGTGIFIDFPDNKVYKYINGTRTEL